MKKIQHESCWPSGPAGCAEADAATLFELPKPPTTGRRSQRGPGAGEGRPPGSSQAPGHGDRARTCGAQARGGTRYHLRLPAHGGGADARRTPNRRASTCPGTAAHTPRPPGGRHAHPEATSPRRRCRHPSHRPTAAITCPGCRCPTHSLFVGARPHLRITWLTGDVRGSPTRRPHRRAITCPGGHTAHGTRAHA